MSTLHPFQQVGCPVACLYEDRGATSFSFHPNTQSSKKEPLPLLPKGKASQPLQEPEQGASTAVRECCPGLSRSSVSSIPDDEQLLSSSYSLMLCWAGRMAGRWLPQAAVARSCSYSDSFPEASISVRCQNSLAWF